MALLTTGTFARVTFASPVSAAWQALSPIPGFRTGSELADAVSNGSNLDIYVIDAASGTFAYLGGVETGYDDTVVTVASAGTTTSVTPTGGSTTVWCKIASNIYTVGSASVLEEIGAGDASALKAFLP